MCSSASNQPAHRALKILVLPLANQASINTRQKITIFNFDGVQPVTVNAKAELTILLWCKPHGRSPFRYGWLDYICFEWLVDLKLIKLSSFGTGMIRW